MLATRLGLRTCLNTSRRLVTQPLFQTSSTRNVHLFNKLKLNFNLLSKRGFQTTRFIQKEGQNRQSLKELSRKYGWSAVGVYFALSLLDLPICFFMVHSMGQERVSEWELKIRKWLGLSTDPGDLKTAPKKGDDDSEGSKTNWSLILTEFGIAYAIHKSVFIFVRIPATAAITPWAVRTLRKWGFNIGNKGLSSGMSSTGANATKVSGTGEKFGSRPTKRQKWFWFF